MTKTQIQVPEELSEAVRAFAKRPVATNSAVKTSTTVGTTMAWWS